MFRDPLAIEKCRLESILWARRIAGGGPDHIFYESDNEGFIVRCITDLHERRDRDRACRRHLDEHAEQQRRRRGAGVGSDTGGFRESMPRPDLALAREGVRRRRRSTATTREP